MNLSYHPIFHQFLKSLKSYQVTNKKILIACSGGVDSICLLYLMKEVSRILNLEIIVSYIHHGKTKNERKCYRDQAQIFIECLSKGWGLNFITNEAFVTNLKSEESLRNYRYQWLRKWREKNNCDFIALAHNSSDFLETQIIRLIRGTGKQGLIPMSFCKKELLRPLLFFTKEEIQELAKTQKLSWIEDPSNKHTTPLRNWIREVWLKILEKKRPGSLKNLSLSLERISEDVQNDFIYDKNCSHSFTHNKYLNRKKLEKLNFSDQKKTLALWMKKHGVRNYTENHLLELLKRILVSQQKNTPSKEHFKLANKNFTIKEKFILMD